MQKTKKTRNQRKRDMIRSFCMGFACMMLWLMLCTLFVKAWAAEQPVDGREYLASIQNGGDSYGNIQD